MNAPDTEVIRTLDKHGVSYRLLPHDEPVFTVDAAAEQRGVIKEEMVKAVLAAEIQAGKDYTQRAKEAEECGDKGLAVQLEDRVRETPRRANACSGIGRGEPFAQGAESQYSVISVT